MCWTFIKEVRGGKYFEIISAEIAMHWILFFFAADVMLNMPNSMKNVFKNNFRIKLDSEDGIAFNNLSSIFQKCITRKNKMTDIDWNSVVVQFKGTSDRVDFI